MKFFIITLALAVLAGTWGSDQSDEPDSKLEKLAMRWGEDMRSLARTAEYKSELSMRLADEIKLVRKYFWMRFVALREELAAGVVETLDMFFVVPYQAARMPANLLLALKRYGWRDSEELKRALDSYAEPLLEKVGPYAETVRGAIFSGAREIILKADGKMRQQMEALKPQLEAQAEALQEYHASLVPYVDQTQELIRKGLEAVHKHLLKPYVAPTLAVYQKYLKELSGWPTLS